MRTAITMKNFVQEASLIYQAKAESTPATPVTLLGPPGMGKTAIIEGSLPRTLSRTLDCPVDVVSFILSNREATEVAGYTIPVKQEAKVITVRAVSDLVVSVQASPAYSAGVVILNLDEITNCDQMMQKVLANILSANRIGEVQLPHNVWVIGTGNRQEDKTGFVKRLPHVQNRLLEFHVTQTFDDWDNDFAAPANLPLITRDFARVKADDLNNPTMVDQQPFLTWRSLTNLSRIVKQNNTQSADDSPFALNTDSFFLKCTAEGLIGPEATAQLWQHATLREHLPTPAQIATDPMTAPIPPAHLLGARFACAQIVTAHATPATADQFIRYTERLPRDLQATIIRNLNARMRSGLTLNSPALHTWMNKPENAALIQTAASFSK